MTKPAIDEPADDLLDALIRLIEARIDNEPSLAEWAGSGVRVNDKQDRTSMMTVLNRTD